MDYLTLEIRNEAKETVFRHDFRIEAIQPAVDQITAGIRQRGTLLPQEICRISLTPRYEGTPQYEAEYISTDRIEVDRACREVNWKTGRSPYALAFDRTPDAELPVAYWSLAIHPETHRILYRRDLPITAWDQYVSEVKAALNRSQQLPPEVATSYRFFARSDDKGQFLTLTELGRSPTGELQIELKESRDIKHQSADKAKYLERSDPVTVKDTTDDIPLFVRRSALVEIDEHIAQNPDRESGGVLVGQVYGDTATEELFVEVIHAIPARLAAATATSLRFTPETWQEINIEKQKRFQGQQLLTVGWYHSHLVATRLLDKNGKVGYTDLFFSIDDMFIHEHFFKEPWHVALVLSPHHQQRVFFQWRTNPDGTQKMAICGTYYILEDPSTDRSLGGEQ
jgi:proteasome lid subunit RPN8/RPN11